MNYLTPDTVFAKDFRVVRILAQGGMGAVYEAAQAGSSRRVALKLMHPSQVSDPKLRRRFAQEARVGAWIGSEHIVEVIRAGVDEGTGVPWLAMELLQGQTLAQRIARCAPSRGVPHDEAWLVLSQLCRALIAAHDKGVVHRDLKPENVFLTDTPRTDAPFTVKILDFGIAKRLDPKDAALNRTAAIGTPLWMPPEQNETAELTPAADVWALGLVCFRMFTGRFYWLAANEPELNLGWLYAELVSEPLASAEDRADALGCKALLPAGFNAWFARCLHRDPAQRFASARELAAGLAAFAPSYFTPFAASSLVPGVPQAPRASAPSAPPTPTVAMAYVPAAPVQYAQPRPSPVPQSLPSRAPQSAPHKPPSRPSGVPWALVAVGVLMSAAALTTAAWFFLLRDSAPPQPPAAQQAQQLPQQLPQPEPQQQQTPQQEPMMAPPTMPQVAPPMPVPAVPGVKPAAR